MLLSLLRRQECLGCSAELSARGGIKMGMRPYDRIGIACVCILAMVATCPAAVITVCQDGSGAYDNIQDAIGAAADGDEIVVCPGTYNERINLMGKAVTLRSTHGARETIIDATGQGDAVVLMVSGEGADTVMIGFTLTGGVGADDGGGARIRNSSPTIMNCAFVGNTSSDGGGMEIVTTGEPVSEPQTVNCLFRDNHANVGLNPNGGAVRICYSQPKFTNCTFYGNTAVRCGGGIACFESISEFVNCVLWGNSDGSGTIESAQVYSDPNSTTIFRCSCIEGCDTFCTDPNGHNIGDDPKFVDAASGDLRLRVVSPCIDAGDTTVVPAELFVDLDNNGRRLDWPGAPDTGIPAGLVLVTVDMGAYEFRLPIGDCNLDGVVNTFDIDPFVDLLTGN